MGGIQLRVLPDFPAQVVAVSPIVVTRSGLTYTFSFSPPSSFYKGSETVAESARLRRQLVNIGKLSVVDSYIIANFGTSTTTFLNWNFQSFLPLFGTVSDAIGLAIPFTTGELTQLWLDAFNLPDI